MSERNGSRTVEEAKRAPSGEELTPARLAMLRERVREALAVLRARYSTGRRGAECTTGIPRAAARATGIDLASARRWHLGQQLPATDDVLRLCTATGWSADYLLGYDVPKDRAPKEPEGLRAAALYAMLKQLLTDPTSEYYDSRYSPAIVRDVLQGPEHCQELIAKIIRGLVTAEYRRRRGPSSGDGIKGALALLTTLPADFVATRRESVPAIPQEVADATEEAMLRSERERVLKKVHLLDRRLAELGVSHSDATTLAQDDEAPTRNSSS